MIFNRKNVEVTKTINRATKDANEWITSIAGDEHLVLKKNTDIRIEMGGWKKPPAGWTKCNYDVSHHEGDRDSGLGWIIRNVNGVFMEGSMGKF